MMKDDIRTLKNRIIELENIINALPGHVYWKNSQGEYLGCNYLQAIDLNLKSVEDIIGKTDFDFSPDEEARLYRATDQEVFEKKQSIVAKEPKVLPDGSIIMYLSEKVPLKNLNNKVIGVLGVSVDATKFEKQLEMLGQEKEQIASTLNQIIANMPGHVYWKNSSYVYIGCNDAQAKSAGFSSRREMIGKTDYEMPWRDQANILRAIDERVLKNNEVITAEEPSEMADGTLRYFLSKKLPLKNTNHETVGIIGISIDITDKKRAEELQKAMEIAEAKIKSLQMTAAAIAHEMRTPMRTVDACASGLADYLPALLATYQMAKQHQLDVPPIPEQLIKNLTQSCEAIRFEVRETFNIIDMLLMNARLKNLEQIELSVCSIKANIETALSRYTFDQHERELIHWQSDQDFLYFGNEILTIHVVFNLLKNALWQIKKAGKGEIFIRIETTEKYHLLKFKDTAAGIDPETLPKIFQQFFSQTTHGTGVGLAFCEMVFKRYQGEISCQSKLGEYAEFIMKFPKIESA